MPEREPHKLREWFSLGAYIFTAADYGTDPYCVTCLPCLALFHYI